MKGLVINDDTIVRKKLGKDKHKKAMSVKPIAR